MELAEQRLGIAVGEREIEQRDRDRMLRLEEHVARAGERGRRRDVKAFVLEERRHGLSDGRVVLDDERGPTNGRGE